MGRKVRAAAVRKDLKHSVALNEGMIDHLRR